jgi:hypothetical protein
MWIKIPHRSTENQPLIGYIQHLFVQERPRVPSAIQQFTNSRCFTYHVPVLVRRCLPALAAIVIALILQSQKFTTLCCLAVYLFCWCAHYSTTLECSIQQSNRQADRTVSTLALQFVSVSFHTKLTQVATFFAVFDK